MNKYINSITNRKCFTIEEKTYKEFLEYLRTLHDKKVKYSIESFTKDDSYILEFWSKCRIASMVGIPNEKFRYFLFDCVCEPKIDKYIYK